jgi:hypothetical protein
VAQHPGYPKTAACACGALSVTMAAPPVTIHACSCLDCQRRSGSAFTYTAFFAEAGVSVTGEHRSWRRSSEAGRFHESNFCPTCGNAVFYRLEVLPGMMGVPVGNFADPAFGKPAALYWTVHRHSWMTIDTVVIERQ